MDEILAVKVMAGIAAIKKIPIESITADSTFEQLAMDSLDAMNLLFTLEEELESRFRMRRRTLYAMCAARWREWNESWRRRPQRRLREKPEAVLLEGVRRAAARTTGGGHRRGDSLRAGQLRRRLLGDAVRGAGDHADRIDGRS